MACIARLASCNAGLLRASEGRPQRPTLPFCPSRLLHTLCCQLNPAVACSPCRFVKAQATYHQRDLRLQAAQQTLPTLTPR